ncbi:MAG: radical SAM family heme chaperone HemW [Bacilli bacterium]|nr:radical SAM family heme chaperone HemW [Bacilli bacterium]
MTSPKRNSPSIEALYVHIPFCKGICPYCDFPKVYYDPNWADAYLARLEEEAATRCVGPFSTLYVGGGTPSALSPKQLERLLSFLAPFLKEGGEFSMEANPESLDEEKIALLARYGVNRVSLGVQSCQEKGIKTLGRNHDREMVQKAIDSLRRHGIANINLDLMYGFPDQSEDDLLRDIADFLSFGVPHLSCYSLILEQGTVYATRGVQPLDEDTQQRYFDIVLETLEKAGYARYEISNFAKPGFQCLHNRAYWKDLRYIGLGLGAASYEGNVRRNNTKSLSRYLDGRFLGEEETLDEAGELEDYFLTNLRLVEGFTLKEFEDRFGFSFLERYGDKAHRLEKRGLLSTGNGRVVCTKLGLDLLDMVLLELF